MGRVDVNVEVEVEVEVLLTLTWSVWRVAQLQPQFQPELQPQLQPWIWMPQRKLVRSLRTTGQFMLRLSFMLRLRYCLRLMFKSKLSTMPGQDYARLRQDYAGRLRCGLERSLLLMDSHYCFCVAVCPSTYLCREQQSRAWGTTHRKPRRGKPHARNPGVGN